VVWACGSSPEKKRIPTGYPGEAGSAGEANAAGDTSSSGGSGATGAGGGQAASGGVAGDQVAPDAGSSGTLGDAGAAGAGPTPPPFHGLYVSPTGLDTNGGSLDAPFLTVAHAVTLAQAGDTIVLLDGTFAPQGHVNVPDSVNVMAENSGMAKVACSFGAAFTFLGSSRVEGLEFDACSQPIVATTSGTLTLVNLFLSNAGAETGAIHIGGTVVATLTGDADHVYTQSGQDPVFVDGSASLTITGGIFKNVNNEAFSGNGMLRTAGSAKLVVKNVTVVDVQQTAISAADTSSVLVDHTTLDMLASNVILLRNTATLTVQNQSRLAIEPLAPTRYECLRSEGSAGITISDTEITGCSTAINAILPPTLTISAAKIHDNLGLAIDMTTSGNATLSISNSELYNNGGTSTQIHGVMRVSASVLTLKFRGVNVHNNGATYNDYYGINISGALGSVYDFGTLADPGQNTLLGNGVSGAALTIQSPSALSVPAVGNTWTPNLQGAGTDGKYVVPAGASKVLEVNGPVTALSPANYHLATTGVLRLAELP
jgi:hypothetical protein